MSENRTNQTNEVVKYLKRHKSITSKQAFEMFGVTRLSSMISRLRSYGYVIDTIMMTGKDRYGSSCNFGMYILKSEPEPVNTKA